MDEDSIIDDTIDNDLADYHRRKGHREKPKFGKTRRRGKRQAHKANKSIRNKIKNTLLSKVGLSCFWGLSGLFLLVATVGIISFITSMPGMVQEGILKTIFEGLTKFKYDIYGSDYYLTELAEDTSYTRQKEVLKYLDDMGFEPVSFGFVAYYKRNGDEVEYSPSLFDDGPHASDELMESGDPHNIIDLLKQYKLAKEYQNEVTHYTINNDLIFKYIASNERAYLVHNLEKVGEAVRSTTSETESNFINGMIETDIEGIDDSEITVDRMAKQMVITSKNTELKNLATFTQTARYNLESYTARYGMPLEFLLALHIGSMSPDLADEIVSNENLQTVVRLISEKDEYDAEFEITYKGEELPFSFGTKSEVDDLYSVEIDAKNHKVDLGDNDPDKIKDKVTIYSLYHWLEKHRNPYIIDQVNEYFIDLTAKNAKDALLGSGMYRVLYRLQGNNYYIEDEGNWKNTAWFGNLDDGSDIGAGTSAETEDDERDSKFFSGQEEISEVMAADGSTKFINIGLSTSIILPSANDKFKNVRDFIESSQYYTEKTENGDDRPSDYVSTFDDSKNGPITYTTGVIHGLQYYMGHPEEIRNERDWLGIMCMLSQLDTFYYRKNVYKMDDIPQNFTNEHVNEVQDYTILEQNSDYVKFLGLPRTAGGHGSDTDMGRSLHLFLAAKWWYFCMLDMNNVDDNEIRAVLGQLMRDINAYYELYEHQDEILEDAMHDLFKQVGFKDIEITIDDIYALYKLLAESREQTFEYVTTRIAYVVKHWYKDIIFEIPKDWTVDDNEIESAYEKTLKPIRLPYELQEKSDDVEVTIVLSPQDDDVEKSNIYKQVRQPYVVKGDVVLLDGERVEDSGLENGNTTILLNGGFEEYTVGDGYRTMKKLLTQGQYYTVDGTTQTAKSILWCKKLEYATSATVKVKNGRIMSISSIQTNDMSPIQAIEATKTASEASVAESGVDDTGMIHTYTVSRSCVPYISVGHKYDGYTEEEVLEASQKSVELINKMLDDMGVVTKRKEVSFDNKTAGGDVVTLTAFGLLEGMHSEASQYIYRDFKEMLIELGYYTKAEFDNIDRDVLEWFLPGYRVKTKEDSLHWRQNKEEDSLDYGAIIYPVGESEFKRSNDGTDTDEDDEESEENKILGIKAGMTVVAPGNCTVEASANGATLTFDGISQPEIASLDKYQMIIEGISLSASGMVEAGDTIGTTTGARVKVILKNNVGGYVDNIEDYMRPPVTSSEQKYPFTKDEIILLAYAITKECAPEGLSPEWLEDSEYYDSKEEEAMAFAEGVGYVLINRALCNYSGYGTTIEEQFTVKSQWATGVTIEYAKEHQSEISAGAMQAAEHCAKYGCDSIVNPDGVQMTEDVLGYSAWKANGEVFWWLDKENDGEQNNYPVTTDPGPIFDSYLTYSR